MGKSLPVTNTGNKYLLNVIDHATRHVESFAIPSADAYYTQKAFTEMFSRHRLPGKLLTDRGSTFVSETFQGFLRDLGVQHLLSSPYHPQTNGAMEMLNGTLKI